MSKVALITSNHQRHLWVANQISKSSDLCCVISERKRKAVESKDPCQDQIISQYLINRSESEKEWFRGAPVKFNQLSKDYKCVDWNSSNESILTKHLSNLDLDYILLFGCSIIREPLLSIYKNKIINMHLGLSPYYRGTATNFWPLVDLKPECVGVTIHYATNELDGGNIILQARPSISKYDTVHDIGCKTIIKGIKLLKSILEYKGNLPSGVKQRNHGILRKRSDFNAKAVKTLEENFAAGMIEKYIEQKHNRDLSFPIVDSLLLTS